MDPDTGEPQDTLTPKAKQLIENLGSKNTRVFDILAQEDKAVFDAIEKGLEKVNEDDRFQAKRVCVLYNVLTSLIVGVGFVFDFVFITY